MAIACAGGCTDNAHDPIFYSVQPSSTNQADDGAATAGSLANRSGSPTSSVIVASHFANDGPWEDLPLIRLPEVADEGTPTFVTPAPTDELSPLANGPALLPPQAAPPADAVTLEYGSESINSFAKDATTPVAGDSHGVAAWNPAAAAEAAALLDDAAPPITGSPTGAVVSERAEAKIRRGYALAQRGANFAARSEFIEVLRMIAQAKDQKHGAPRRTVALANGLRALDEAADFSPQGSEFDARLGLDVIVSSHRTPVAKSAQAEGLMAQQLAALYFRYAQLQLGAAVAGEPAGSMALHALGKLYSQLGRVEADKHPQAERRAFALQQAALLARPDNYMAAHELGVLLAESGHYAEAENLLGQVSTHKPHAIVYRNLARVQRKLGNPQLAEFSGEQARLLEQQSGDESGPVIWVDPTALARTGDAVTPTPAGIVGPTPPQPRPAGPMINQPPVRSAQRTAPGFVR